ncbi:hypothetical protein V8C44DRAFT_330677 [Trichoderma aethiopicum]
MSESYGQIGGQVISQSSPFFCCSSCCQYSSSQFSHLLLPPSQSICVFAPLQDATIEIPVIPYCTSHFAFTWSLPTSRHFYLYLIHAKYGWNELDRRLLSLSPLLGVVFIKNTPPHVALSADTLAERPSPRITDEAEPWSRLLTVASSLQDVFSYNSISGILAGSVGVGFLIV